MIWFREFAQALQGLTPAEMMVVVAIWVPRIANWILVWLLGGSRKRGKKLREQIKQLEAGESSGGAFWLLSGFLSSDIDDFSHDAHCYLLRGLSSNGQSNRGMYLVQGLLRDSLSLKIRKNCLDLLFATY